MDTRSYGVYIRVDDLGRLTAITSDASLSDTTGWIKMDEGRDDRYRYAQCHYLPEMIVDERGVYRYKLLDGAVIVARSAAEMDADATQIVVSPTPEKRLALLEKQNAMLTECLLEMSELVYA